MHTLATAASLAWRNVWRNTRRTVLTLLTILVGCAMIIFMNAISKGGHDQMVEDSVSLDMGHAQIHAKGYWENRTVDYAFIPNHGLLQSLRADRRIQGWAPRIHADGLVAVGTSSAGAMIQGIDPELDRTVSCLSKRVVTGGRYLQKGDTAHAVIGEILAKNLSATVGSTITLLSQDFDGSIAADKLTIVGLLRTGNPEYDQGIVEIPLARARDTFAMGEYIHSIAIRTKSVDSSYEVINFLTASNRKNPVEIMGWLELMPELKQFIDMDTMQGWIFDVILFVVVAFGILNTVQMSVFERTREFGVMLSIGTRPQQIVQMVLFESLYISIVGVALGALAGGLLSWYYFVYPMDFSEYAKEISVYGINTIIYPSDATPLNIFVTVSVTLFLGVFFSYFPARRASRLNPIDAIRHL